MVSCKTKTSLDREEQDSPHGHGHGDRPIRQLSATVNVTIKVTNENEDPVLTGPESPRVAENTPSTTAVATYVAMDDEDDSTGTAIRWTLGGDNSRRLQHHRWCAPLEEHAGL